MTVFLVLPEEFILIKGVCQRWYGGRSNGVVWVYKGDHADKCVLYLRKGEDEVYILPPSAWTLY